MSFKTNATIIQFGGILHKLSHDSALTKTPMDVNVFIPPINPTSTTKQKIPVLIYLSGLTCTPQNATENHFSNIGPVNMVSPLFSPIHHLEELKLKEKMIHGILVLVLGFMLMLLNRHGIKIIKCIHIFIKNY